MESIFFATRVTGVNPVPYVPRPLAPDDGDELLHISSASIPASCSLPDRTRVSLMLTFDEAEPICIATMIVGVQESVALDLNIDGYSEFSVVCSDKGKKAAAHAAESQVHVVGYYVPRSADDDDEDDDEDGGKGLPTQSQLQQMILNGDLGADDEDDDEEDDEDEDEEDDEDEDEQAAKEQASPANGKGGTPVADVDAAVEADDDEDDSEDDSDEEDDSTVIHQADARKAAGGASAADRNAASAAVLDEQDEEDDDDDDEDDDEDEMEGPDGADSEDDEDDGEEDDSAEEEEEEEDEEEDENGKQQVEVPTKRKAEAPMAVPPKRSKKQVFSNGFEVHSLLEAANPSAAQARPGKVVQVRYKGTLANGKVFDQTKGSKTFKFRLGTGEVIKGWDRGVAGMRVGDRRKLIVPPAMAYGDTGVKGVIPRNATLTFEVELCGVK